MEELITIVKAFNKWQLKYQGILSNDLFLKRKSKYILIYNGILEGSIKNESDVQRILQLQQNPRKLNRFILEFRNRIIYSFLFFKSNEYSKDRGGLNVKLAALKNLNSTGFNKFGINELEKFIRKTIKLEYYNLALEAIIFLKSVLVTQPKLKNKFMKYMNLYYKIYEIWSNEQIAVNTYELFITKSLAIRGQQVQLINELSERLTTLEGFDLDNQSKLFKKNYFNLKLYLYSLKGEHENVIRLASSILANSQTRYSGFNNRETTYRLTMATSQMMLNNFIGARENINKVYNLNIEGSKNWFKTKEIEVTNELYSGDYLTAWKITKEIIKHVRFNSISQLDQETWKSLHAYLCFLIRAGAFDVSNRERGEANQLKVAVLQQEMPLYNKDKRGANISLLILQILFDLLDKDTELVVNRVEALRKYKQRNLDTEHEHYRTDCFIRMLEMVVKHHFNHKKVLERTPKWLDKLKEKPRDFSSQHYEVEILPYETLWEWVLKLTKAVWT